MRLVVLQPGYLPWLGYFHQLSAADLFVHLDDVQFDKHGWRNRNRIRTAEATGWSWLTVPVRTKGRFGDAISEIEIDNGRPWAEKHWRSLAQNYRRAPHFDAYAPDLEALYRRPWERLVDLDLALIEWLARALDLTDRRIVRTSALHLPSTDDPTERLLALCSHLGATEYFSGKAASAYLDESRFAKIGVAVTYQDYHHPEYPQRYPGFVSHLSTVDLLFNVGPKSLEILTAGQTIR